MEILNTIAGEEILMTTAWGWIVPILIVGGIAIALLSLSSKDNSMGAGIVAFIGTCACVLGIMIYALPIDLEKPTGEFEPSRYEVVITDPDFIIDATKYRFIKERGSIIILEEVK